MSIKHLQTRLTQVGVIRLGEKRLSAKGKEYPAKLDTFRVTSPSKALIDAVAKLLGGEPRPWRSKTGPEWEVVTNATEIAVHVPPQVIDPNYELWGNGYRARLCDGETERIRGTACLCEAAARQRYERLKMPWPADGLFERNAMEDCKPTTRLTLMISDIPSGVGTFKLESHGLNAAAELPALSSAIAAASQPIPAVLRLQQREGGVLKVTGNGAETVEARKYAVPVLDFFGLFTPRQAFSGELETAIQQAIGGSQQAALDAAPAEAPKRDWLAEIAAADTAVRLNNLKEDMQAAGIRDAAIVEAWKARGAAIVDAAKPTSAPPAVAQPTRTSEPAAAEDVEVEPDRDDVWTAILREAKKSGWNLSTVQAKYRERMGHDADDAAQATGWRYTEFLTALRKGEVAA